jgi:hypothetical protein
MNDNEVCQLVFYVQSFATIEDYNAKWGPQYSDSFARNLKNQAVVGSLFAELKTDPFVPLITFMAVLLWNMEYNQLTRLFEAARQKVLMHFSMSRRRTTWM